MFAADSHSHLSVLLSRLSPCKHNATFAKIPFYRLTKSSCKYDANCIVMIYFIFSNDSFLKIYLN